jgi:CBS domain containing-hemolysin-like protein
VTVQGYILEIVEMEGRRVKKVRVLAPPPKEAPEKVTAEKTAKS